LPGPRAFTPPLLLLLQRPRLRLPRGIHRPVAGPGIARGPHAGRRLAQRRLPEPLRRDRRPSPRLQTDEVNCESAHPGKKLRSQAARETARKPHDRGAKVARISVQWRDEVSESPRTEIRCMMGENPCGKSAESPRNRLNYARVT